jgi:cyclic beta-1,2-glucan synthetase
VSTRTERSRVDASEEPLVGPIHGELLGADHLAARARLVARERRLVVGRLPPRPARLLARLEDTRRLLTDAHTRLTSAASEGVDAGPAAEWFLDNYHVVQEHLQEVRTSLPGGYYRELPELASGPLTGYPRVYEIAISLISHTEARVDLENVDLYVEAFQSVAPLSIGELWAMPAMLRLGLIESVRRMTLRTVQRLDDIALAAQWSEHILAASSGGGSELRLALREFIEADHALTPHFVSRFLQSLRQAEGASAPLAWLEHWLRDTGVSPETAVAQATQHLALTQIMMANSITSLRDIGRRDWKVFVEKQSVLEAGLREDPSGFYPRMTFATRDRYRHVVERIARQTGHRESSIARWAVDLARREPFDPGGTGDARRAHVGYYLIDEGLEELERIAGYAPPPMERLERLVHAHPNAVYIGGLSLLTVLATLAITLFTGVGVRDVWWVILFFVFLPALDVAVTVFNQLVSNWLPPRLLPRLDLHEAGVPAEFRTAVVIPTLFADVEAVHEALENVEVQFLANREAHLHFAILSDFTDADAEELPGDGEIIAAALEGVRALNARYAPGGPDEFHLLHRPRRWNAQEGVWMGWERKRGKLSEFNRLLRGGPTDAFSVISGDTSTLQDVRFVITLDSDTVLPPDAAPSLVGALAHPLNRAVYDADRKRVVRGYGILQPRVGVSLPSAHRSSFASIASGHPGVDPYTTAVSDVYQDLYGEGSFTGKGIYDLDAFEQATHGRFPENTLLSHDLIEGNYARAGLATDVIVYDEYPSSYVTYTKRKHRWIRGDWQLLPWLRPMVPGPDGPEPNRLSVLSRWKILDNLRRSLVEISQVLLLVGGWTVLPGSPWKWTLVGLSAVFAPWITSVALAMVRPPRRKSWRAYYAAVAQDLVVHLQQAAVTLTGLVHQAAVSADAIIRTLYRLGVSKRQLLEWQSASFVERSVSNLDGETWRSMRATQLALGAGVVAVTAAAVRGYPVTSLVLNRPNAALALVSLLFLLWLSAPAIMAQLSRVTVSAKRRLSQADRVSAMHYATRQWQFFAHHVTEATRWLAPDNVQTDPELEVAMRTSPTNIGLQLMATVSALDLGLITAEEMTKRLERAFETLAVMARHRGHFYNWYGLPALNVLHPPYVSVVDSGNLAGHLIAVRQACLEVATREPELCARLHAIADEAYAFVDEMDFSFLYNRARKLFTIGYHPESFTPDASYYDLLASEARLASFIAIARNDVPVEHWFRLSRALNRTEGATALLSWSGSMFEYLMPALVMRSLPYTLLDQTYRGAVARHISFARERGVPWGASESAYNFRDRHQTYQYRAFGVPDLALKRGLGRDLVIAPYASALAAMVDAPRALANLHELEAMGTLGDDGFCDAVDYTRPAPDRPFAIVQTHMAHHIGMTLVALTNVLRNDIWQERFHADPLVKAAELLLHERVPRRLVMRKAQSARPAEARPETDRNTPVVREVDTNETTEPRVALLGSVPYTVMLNHNGSGYSRYESIDVTRWQGDRTLDDTGQYCYLKDVETGRVWSSGLQPVGARADWSRARLASDRVTLHRVDGDIETRTDITVVPGDSAEVRRVTLTNTGRETRDIELTSYGEVVMTTTAADRAHPAFSNLFVETEWHGWCSAITATRRSREQTDQRLWCVHVVDAGRDRIGEVSCETDRARFVGRGRSLRNPVALETDGNLSGTTGPVLDPIVALRTRVRVRPGQSTSVAFTTLVANSREEAFALADRYHDSRASQRALDMAWATTDIELKELGITPANAAVFQDLATQLLYAGGSLGPPPDELRRNQGSQPKLWPHGISGDLPLVLATIDSLEGLTTLRELFAAHRYWRRRGLTVDLVVINAHAYDYLQELRDGITEAMFAADDAALIDVRGGVMIRRRDVFQADEYLMLSATARMHIACDGRSLSRILAGAEARRDEPLPDVHVDGGRMVERPTPVAMPAVERGPLATIVTALRPLVKPLLRRTSRSRESGDDLSSDVEGLRFFNGIGGLDEDDSYQMVVDDTNLPPAPWVNVIANLLGGFLVSERGAGCTWAENAYFYRLTPWHNDPVSDPISDVLFLQDAESGTLWSATPAPITGSGPYRVRHGSGSTTFEHEHDGISTELVLGMPDDTAVKLSLLRVRNLSDDTRRLRVTAYVDWALGPRRVDTQYQVITRAVPELGAIFARNHFDPSFATWTAFLATSEALTGYTADRQSFIGPNESLADPAALRSGSLNGATGVGLDPCAALQVELVLAPGEAREVTVMLGAARNEDEARQVIQRLRAPGQAKSAVTQSLESWNDRLSVITVRTPDDAFDAMLNRWTLYQALACRMWARTGLYQSSGAYGFRDQLQDVMAFVYADPQVAREHILRAAQRQFVEGDVQHWWHPQTGRGVRTRFSDDLAWLPYVVDRYVEVTSDAAILDVYVPFITMRPLEPHEHELYDLPTVTDEHGSVYEHCRRALRHACTTGPHGLPLIGTGDWNDGMSRVGAEGRGESVWLAWFLIATLRSFSKHADARGDHHEADYMRQRAGAYAEAIEASGWDGHWYRRAYYDDGTPLGSASSDECRIDSIAQSWSVIAAAGSPARRQLAMRALNEHLVSEDARVIMLLKPPFDRGSHDPGYIKGYVPGVRENGAQYTHAALWAVMATARQGDGDRAFELLQMINPLNRSANEADMKRYKVEPYVVAADIYTAPSHVGRGGWTWYTGSASWMYRVGLEEILGFRKVGGTLRIEPRVPGSWTSYEVTYRFGESTWEISVRDPAGVQLRGAEVTVNGKAMADGEIHLVDDGKRHVVVVAPKQP